MRTRADRSLVRSPRSAGPARYLAEHPLAYVLSVAGSGGLATYALAAAARAGRRHRETGQAGREAGDRRRVLWLALGAQCAAQLAGIVISTERARRKAKARSG